MPKEVKSLDELLELARKGKVREVRVSYSEERVGNEVRKIAKVKLRLARYLYTLKVPREQVDEVLSKIKEILEARKSELGEVPIVEFGKK